MSRKLRVCLQFVYLCGGHARKRGCSEKKSETKVSEQGTTASGVAQDSRPVSISIISQPEQFVKDFHRTEDDVVAEFNQRANTSRKDQLGHPTHLVYHIL